MPEKNIFEFSPCAKSFSRLSAFGFSYPRFHEGKQWYVDFVCLDPVTHLSRRKKYNVPAAANLRDRRAIALSMVHQLTLRLEGGWNPFSGNLPEKIAYPWDKICREYLDYIQHQYKTAAIKLSSLQNYTTYYNAFLRYIKSYHSSLAFANQLSRSVVVGFLQYLVLELDVSARTRNNYHVWLFSFCEYLREKEIFEVNPVAGLKKMKEGEKFRNQLSPSDLHKLRCHLEKTDKHFLLACLMEYYTFIRPEELCSVKIGDIFLKEQKIVLHSENTKNRKDAAVGLNQELIHLMLELDTFSHSSEEYLFGTTDFLPSPVRKSGRIFRQRFLKLRKELGFDDSYQFYSLKDTGIRDLANAKGIVIARDQARHSDISTTNKYLKEDSFAVHDETKDFRGSF